MKNRSITKYLCFICENWQEKEPTNEFKIYNNDITHLFCCHCNDWIPVEKTSIGVGKKYIIQYMKYPTIIDNDYSFPKEIFSGNNIKALEKVCDNYNNTVDYSFKKACCDYRNYVNEMSLGRL